MTARGVQCVSPPGGGVLHFHIHIDHSLQTPSCRYRSINLAVGVVFLRIAGSFAAATGVSEAHNISTQL